MLLGTETDTQDTTGQITNQTPEEEVMKLSEEKVFDVIKSYIGEYDQIPPMFSAIKINGQKLYNLARKGEEIERPPRHCKIIDITITKIDLPRVSFHVTCSKGTYVRTLCYDIGKDLGVGACMEKLTRTRVERFDIKDSISLSQIEEIRDQEFWNSILLLLTRFWICIQNVWFQRKLKSYFITVIFLLRETQC